ncbi:MAG TPA: hypothetical protein VHO43_19600 [Ignavibacteriales bacterium]|nr:hypothetical protein [Ignavibacteriales bacterium]
MKKKIFKLLYKSFETEIAPAEKKILEQERQRHPELDSIRDEISEIRMDMRTYGKRDFPADFENNLYRRLTYGIITDELTISFRKVSLSGAIVLAFLLLYNLNAGNDNIARKLLGLSEANIEYAFNPSVQLMWTNSK